MLLRSRIVTFLALAMACAGTAGAASAADRVVDTYDMTYTGSAIYAKHDLPPGVGGVANWDWEAAFSWSASASGVQIANGEVVGLPQAPVTLTIDHAATEYTWKTPSTSTEGQCSGTTAEDPVQGNVYSKPGADGAYMMAWDPMVSVSLHMTGCTGALEGLPLGMELGDGDGLGAQWSLPRDAQRSGQIIIPVHQLDDTDCPERQPYTLSCEWAWSGQITLTRTGHVVVPDPTAPPAPTPAPSGPTGDPLVDKTVEIINQDLKDHPTGDPVVDDTVRAIQHYLDAQRAAGTIKTKFSGHGSRAEVELPCPSTCTGTVSARPATGPKSSGSPSALAVARFRMAGGARPRAAVAATAASKAVATLTFGRSAQHMLAKRGWVAFRITMKIAGAPEAQRTTLVVKVPRG